MTGFLNQNIEAVSRLKIAVEINLTAEDVCQGHRQLNRFSGFGHRRDHRGVIAVDAATHRDDLNLLVVGNDRRFEP